MRYMDPLTDFGFKKIFTEPDGQPLLLSLLNDVLALSEPMTALRFPGRMAASPADLFQGSNPVLRQPSVTATGTGGNRLELSTVIGVRHCSSQPPSGEGWPGDPACRLEGPG